jgi:hypothetical protein
MKNSPTTEMECDAALERPEEFVEFVGGVEIGF